MDKNKFINKMDSQTNQLFNERNIWGIIYDYIDKCFMCNKIFEDETKKRSKYYYGNKRMCYNCIDKVPILTVEFDM